MEFRTLTFQCSCGRSSSRIRQLGLTGNHELVLRWYCAACRRRFHAVMHLSDLWRECPPIGGGRDLTEADLLNAGDAQFLHSLGVRLPDGDC
jgi:hypothetical protein